MSRCWRSFATAKASGCRVLTFSIPQDCRTNTSHGPSDKGAAPKFPPSNQGGLLLIRLGRRRGRGGGACRRSRSAFFLCPFLGSRSTLLLLLLRRLDGRGGLAFLDEPHRVAYV